MTKLLILSDSHNSRLAIENILAAEADSIDALVFLGDGLRDLEQALTFYPSLRAYAVAGNCDFFSNLPKTQIIEIDGQRILITHGHYYYVSVGTRDLVEEAKVNHCTIAMFGHTHKPFVDQSDPELTVLNPGSLSFPRQEGRRPSYITMDLEENKAPVYEIHYL